MSKNKILHAGLIAQREELLGILEEIDDLLILNGISPDRTPRGYAKAIQDYAEIEICIHNDPSVNEHAPISTHTQSAVTDWVIAAFGRNAMKPVERGRRLLEESAEFGQAVGLPKEEALHIVTEVYKGEPGDSFQELGGVGTTLLAAASSVNVELCDAVNTELHRVKNKPLKEMADRQAAKAARGMSE